MLEIIDKGATTARHPTPLLFVHGGYHAAWCWDDHFLDHFADYVDDVRAAAERLGGAPVLVAHSMGG